MNHSIPIDSLKDVNERIQALVQKQMDTMTAEDGADLEEIQAIGSIVMGVQHNLKLRDEVESASDTTQSDAGATLPQTIDGQDSNALIEEYGPAAGYDAAALRWTVEQLELARRAKAEFKQNNAAMLTEQKALNDTERKFRRTVYAQTALAVQFATPADLKTLQDTLPEGIGHTPRYEVQGDPQEIFDYCLAHGHGFLQVNRRLFDAWVMAENDTPNYVPASLIPLPARVVLTTLPTISNDLGALVADESKESNDEDPKNKE